MGASPSSGKSKNILLGSERELVKLMMPIFYCEEHKISREENKVAKSNWELVINDRSPEFLARREKASFQYQSCISFLYDTFYTRLFDIHPLSRQLFVQGTNNQGKLLVKMIGLALTELENEEDVNSFEKTLHHLAKVHFERGVKAVECKLIVTLFCCCLFLASYIFLL